MSLPIQIPPDAPFLTAEQHAWLADFLAKILAKDAGPSASGPPIPATILYGSQTGNAEGLAKKLAKILTKNSFAPAVHNLADYQEALLPTEKNLLLICSTYGDGEPPDTALDFHTFLLSDRAPRLENVTFSVLALGDSTYPDFCKCGIDLDERLEALGARRISPRVDVDVDPDAPFAQWSANIVAALAPSGNVPQSDGLATEPAETGYSRKRPFPSTVIKNFNLNQGGDKETHHIELSLNGAEMTYEVGDALGVYPVNDPKVVDEMLAALPFKPAEVPLPDGGEAPLRDALLFHYDIGTLNKPMIQKWQARSGSPFLRSLVTADDTAAWEKFCWGRDLIDLALDHPADFADGEEFVSILKRLQPRLYSIASSPSAHTDEVHLCVSIVRYHTSGRHRGGVCSSYLSDRLVTSPQPRVYVHSNPAFRLPADPTTPVIMIGPGTGIAPFRAFLEARQTTAATGKNWLFFGNPHRATDYLYEEDLTNFLKTGLLHKLDLAWSRDQADKIYVQHKMRESGAEFWNWLQNGAAIYVCGDASRMAKDVDLALHEIVSTHGNLTMESAATYVSQLKKDKRYLRDVY